MINTLLVAASLKSMEEILKDNDIPYEIDEEAAYRNYMAAWDSSDQKDKDLFMRQARPAMRRIALKEPYIFVKSGAPLVFRFNDQNRVMADSFGEMLMERADLDWRIAFSLKSSANIIATTVIADREEAANLDHTTTVYNEIDDFGDRIFGVPCSNDYFDDVNAILEKISQHDRAAWKEKMKDDKFAYEQLIGPMLAAIGREIPRICADHPEAPQRLIDFFYGKIDYYYLNPIAPLELTRIGAVNGHAGLGRIPNNKNHYTPTVEDPTTLLDVRFANGKYGELSKDTIQFTFNGGWAVCLKIIRNKDPKYGRNFAISAYMPVTPFGSYRDQVAWDAEA